MWEFMVAQIIVRLEPHVRAGRVRFDGVDITDLSGGGLKPFRRRFQMVFQQHPSLNPRKTVGRTLKESFGLAGIAPSDRLAGQANFCNRSGLIAACRSLPASLSGGQRQRVAIARALAMRPDLCRGRAVSSLAFRCKRRSCAC